MHINPLKGDGFDDQDEFLPPNPQRIEQQAPGGVEAMRAKKAWEEAGDAEEAIRILTGTDKR